MNIAVFAFVVIFSLIVSGGLLLFYREAMLQRIYEVVTPQAKQRGVLNALRRTRFSFGGLAEQLERVLPRSRKELSAVQRRLNRAGYREGAEASIFYGAKILTPVLLCFLALVTGIARGNPLVAYMLAAVAGYIAPDFWLSRRVAKRQARLRAGLPDVLDLLVVCIEAGLSLDQATARTAEELRAAHPAICDELGVLVLEQRAGRPRSDAWKHFAERTGVDSVRNLVSVLVQSEQLGTGIAKTLRIHSETLRTQRRQKVEEQAAKTTVKLVFPLVLFIFPSLFLVTLGPVAIMMAEFFKKFFNQ